METVVYPPEKEKATALIDLDSPVSGTALVSSCTSPFRVPERLRRRLVLECKTPSTVEEIEARLRNADLRRQQYHEKLASLARSKTRSGAHSLTKEDLGRRLEAKLQAAEKKRSSILADAQKRLIRLDELRRAAITGMESHYEEKSLKLGSIVQSRARKAEENRLNILNAYRQRQATLKEKSSLSLFHRIASENKYKERVSAEICQKSTAAERKRLGLVEAKKRKAHARILQVRRVANSVYKQRELVAKMKKESLEDRLTRARRQRAEYLKHRGRQNNPGRLNRMH